MHYNDAQAWWWHGEKKEITRIEKGEITCRFDIAHSGTRAPRQENLASAFTAAKANSCANKKMEELLVGGSWIREIPRFAIGAVDQDDAANSWYRFSPHGAEIYQSHAQTLIEKLPAYHFLFIGGFATALHDRELGYQEFGPFRHWLELNGATTSLAPTNPTHAPWQNNEVIAESIENISKRLKIIVVTYSRGGFDFMHAADTLLSAETSSGEQEDGDTWEQNDFSPAQFKEGIRQRFHGWIALDLPFWGFTDFELKTQAARLQGNAYAFKSQEISGQILSASGEIRPDWMTLLNNKDFPAYHLLSPRYVEEPRYRIPCARQLMAGHSEVAHLVNPTASEPYFNPLPEYLAILSDLIVGPFRSTPPPLDM